mmetsp:Transcript_2511/g.3802  ORF Transcript_2511/g.3802 Transcript_2511/m.3802 type:complete len:758 (-) Transcript_2511:370-2643(-)|eukprot:CAMPEP_0195518702 /NCGR_PEP_ID=MMETSP0794_2-20130614/13527_1 /TAXON_ID=515487 /ORGANISM="Stephanopyxis turris, Strain CCMP 815" /LENGTH=757 /DNA_ID=CAMNT_0040647723 /DNA_START=265 /DNA_END=2538 /DNA_ORIENTATION=-
MKLSIAATFLLLSSPADAFTTSTPSLLSRSLVKPSAGNVLFVAATEVNTDGASMSETSETSIFEIKSAKDVSKLTFRQLQKECKSNGLPAVGTTGVLRKRLVDSIFGHDEPTDKAASTKDANEIAPAGISFSDDSDPDYEFNSLVSIVLEKAKMNHWKAATRKLKVLSRRHATPERPITRDIYVAVLTACSTDRLHGARAAEPARKIMEEMADAGYDIPAELGNLCVSNSLGFESNGMHDGFGGIDTALAMLAAMESNVTKSVGEGDEGVVIPGNIAVETYAAVVSALAKDGAVEEALLLLRAMVVEHSFTPPLGTFADVAEVAVKRPSADAPSSAASQGNESVMQLLTLAKAAGYELDSIASAEAGRSLLACGVIAAERMDNLALGLRLLTAAQKCEEGVAPDRGDDLVASSSSAAQRACTLIHSRAIDKAVKEDNWKLAVRLLQLLAERGLVPSTAVWRKVVTVCAKNEKSRKATALLLDWVKVSSEGKAEKPPLNVFNTVINTCEICGELELTLLVLESMKQTHETDGNIITFNIALKRLAKAGNTMGCEGIIIGMLQEGIEPSVVSYTTAIAACVQAEPKDSATAQTWLKRMRTRNVTPNKYTYNTALASCLDGTYESTIRGSEIAEEMMKDVNRELLTGIKGSDYQYKSVIVDTYTKTLARKLMKQLRDNWRAGEVEMGLAKSTTRVPLLRIVDFDKSEEAKKVKKEVEEKLQMMQEKCEDDENAEECVVELEIEYNSVAEMHKDSHRTAEV